MLKVCTKVGETKHVLRADELWTADEAGAKDFTEKDANAIVEDFRALDPGKEYWAEPACDHVQDNQGCCHHCGALLDRSLWEAYAGEGAKHSTD